MAKLEDVLQYLSPDLINKINLNPSSIKTGILSAIKDFDAVEAANFIKEKATDYAFDTYLGEDFDLTGGGINPDQTDLASGIFSEVGGVALNELGLPVSTADVKDIASVFTDPETGGGDIAKLGGDLISRFGREGALKFIQDKLGYSNTSLALAKFILQTPPGEQLIKMGSDIDDTFFGGYGKKIGGYGKKFYDYPFDILSGIFGNKQNIVPVQEQVVQPDPVFTPPPAITDEADVPYYTGDTGGSYGGGEKFGPPVVPIVPPRPTMADVAGPVTLTNNDINQIINDQIQLTGGGGNTGQTPGPVGMGFAPPPSPRPRPRPRPNPHLAQGGLVSMARVLRR